jgi:hypothetical protein
MKTLVLGATDNPDRYAYKAVHSLKRHGHEVVPVGIRKGQVAGIDIHTDRPQEADIDTVTLYVGPQNQPGWYQAHHLQPRHRKPRTGAKSPGRRHSHRRGLHLGDAQRGPVRTVG